MAEAAASARAAAAEAAAVKGREANAGRMWGRPAKLQRGTDTACGWKSWCGWLLVGVVVAVAED